MTEAALQEQIVEGLRALGYEVLVTSARSVRHGYGADHGVPDLLVSHGSWPRGGWVGIEVKRPGPVKWSHARQRELWEAKRTLVARSLEEACYAIFANRVFLGHSATHALAMRVPAEDREVVVYGG